TAFAALGSDGAVLARSGAEAALMAVNYGSVAKLEALDLAVEAFGPGAVRELTLPPGGCVRWIWSTKELRRSHPSRYCPNDVAPELSYSAAGVALFRYLRDRRERAGLPADRLPEDPTSLLGNSSRATAEQIGGYLHRKLFANDGTCALSDTGALLALRRREGTLRWLAQRWPKLVFSGKTGSSPHDDSAVAAVGLCLDARPVVLVSVLRPLQAPLP